MGNYSKREKVKRDKLLNLTLCSGCCACAAEQRKVGKLWSTEDFPLFRLMSAQKAANI